MVSRLGSSSTRPLLKFYFNLLQMLVGKAHPSTTGSCKTVFHGGAWPDCGKLTESIWISLMPVFPRRFSDAIFIFTHLRIVIFNPGAQLDMC